jgi:hypothetical protein
MNERADLQAIQRLSGPQRGVFSHADLCAVLSEPHRAALYRRVARLVDDGILARVGRGHYVAKEFDLGVLTQRLAPTSAVSFETVLARELVIGPRPERGLSAIHGGRPASYDARGRVIQLHRISPALRFGESVRDAVRSTDAEKALLDVLAYHLRGRRAVFDIYSDVDLNRLNRKRLANYLRRYENPKFVAFARDVLRLS